MSNMKSIGYFTQGLNTGAEFAIREDGAVFSRNKFWNDHFRNYATSKWQRESYWDDKINVDAIPTTMEFGFALNGRHTFVESSRLRLPKEV